MPLSLSLLNLMALAGMRLVLPYTLKIAKLIGVQDLSWVPKLFCPED
ncbi:MAG: hypothetical protein ABFS56_11975 [Pseudomonadota bacterium]